MAFSIHFRRGTKNDFFIFVKAKTLPEAETIPKLKSRGIVRSIKHFILPELQRDILLLFISVYVFLGVLMNWSKQNETVFTSILG